MAPAFKPLALAAILLSSACSVSAQASGSGQTTRYWDCCKSSCAWSGKALVSAPVTTCDIDDNPLESAAARSGCDSNGVAYMCSNNSPWVVDDSLSYGFAAVRISGQTEADWCCACYELTFNSGPVSGKKMVVQAVNTGGDLGANHFDIAMPGGGVGIFNACSDQWGAPPDGWGERYGGLTSNTCHELPEQLQEGCNWRFNWFQNADNPE
ncbi:hypothetical protein AJ80_09125 [Polytolypa hystricis UAMH7299]|uniref:Cellulase n=1 Tax=Polytolypa hystricis (strain UAMH7299) TaxID=1447883 RepID=A0A2B7WVF5_POLH7|nr:hypothetical protein AJ80_09125 [Polytolypa hystricis UAMH7299]